ncbi:hypothetical protein CVD28_02150 [Bacillus sp. M6-12]|uniref:S8 family serine peptidase n=1 Tax=Bacillus sp. M6-12 TaxID=2054166 RepID=UPI000C777D21|nr:S8 family serine peptidase [Bacillus sp. M6-12]PLS19234.1 hypothetical protein CVD28_02150 [Bacillus sp. M6-12]
MNKKTPFLLLMLIVLLFLTPITSFASGKSINVSYNGKSVAFSQVKPYMDNKTHRVMLPVRAVSEKMGAKVTWVSKTKMVIIKSKSKTIILPINTKKAIVNGKTIKLDASASLVKGQVVVPLRFVSEALGTTIKWDAKKNTVWITSPTGKKPVTKPVTKPVVTKPVTPKPAPVKEPVKKPTTPVSQTPTEKEEEKPVKTPVIPAKPVVTEQKEEPGLLKEATGKGVKVAIMDSGISAHSDLTIAGGKNFVDSNASYADGHGHGTIVAGIVAGKKYGLAPDVELYSLRVLDNNNRGWGYMMVNAIDWAIENDIDIINMSIIMDTEDYYLNQAIKKALEHGIILVACAGNNGGNVTNPASLDGVISVGALNSDWKTRAYFSSYIGKVDYMAQGANIYSTNRFGSYDSGWNGTSFSAPYVTGIFALYKEAFPNATAQELKELVLKQSKSVDGQPDWKIPQKPKYTTKLVDNQTHYLPIR